jgi:hypothetical protein
MQVGPIQPRAVFENSRVKSVKNLEVVDCVVIEPRTVNPGNGHPQLTNRGLILRDICFRTEIADVARVNARIADSLVKMCPRWLGSWVVDSSSSSPAQLNRLGGE